VSSFDLDLDVLRARGDGLTAVRSAQVRVHPGGRLEIAVVQRTPVAVWRYADGLRLIDAEGAMTGMIAERADRADLPLIAGDGAKDAIDEALALFAAAAPIAPRCAASCGWASGAGTWSSTATPASCCRRGRGHALQRVIALHQAQEMLDRDIAVVDMRLGDRPTLRLNPPALAQLRPDLAAPEGTPDGAPMIEDN
jgi:cell division protein FtsQ